MEQKMKFDRGSSINQVDSSGGGGVIQMTIFLYKPYLVKVTTKGGGGQKYPKNYLVVYGWPLGNTPIDIIIGAYPHFFVHIHVE